MKVSQDIIDKVLEPYKVRPLIRAEIEYPIINGTFLIGPTYYYSEPVEHATDIEIQLCLNQLAYAGVAQAIINRDNSLLSGLNFDQLRNENMLIVKSQKRFRKPIPTHQEIAGNLRINKLRAGRGLLIAETDFEFENGSCVGSLELVIVKSRGVR